MDRPLWSGDLSVGIVSIAVRMYPALRDLSVHFHQISRKDHRRIRYLKVAEGDREEVPATDIAKGFAVGHGKYVLFNDDELQRLSPAKSKVIAINAFVRLEEIDPRLFDRPYYLVPQERAEKAYHLLVKALADSGRVGVAQMVMHNKEHLVAVRSIDGVLCVETMHFADEVVSPPALKRGPAAKVDGRELAMAEKLIETMSGPFRPSEYDDEYRQRVKQAIARKSRGKPFLVEEAAKEEGGGKVIDLMDALRRSLARRQSGGAAAPAKRHAKPTRKRAG